MEIGKISMENSKVNLKSYFMGLDIGTNSVGWAVTDGLYNVLRKKSEAMWGVLLFDNANQAKDRRGFRIARRINDRKKQRIDILQELLALAIAKVDEKFYIRINESALYKEDKSIDTIYSVFDDENFNDKDYNKKYPTIHHLIKDVPYLFVKSSVALNLS